MLPVALHILQYQLVLLVMLIMLSFNLYKYKLDYKLTYLRIDSMVTEEVEQLSREFLDQ